ncbi:hypothetical protein GGR52DRAFT_362757 [Hypoxylon sp. FL1284]|nr:hypothetical protein GGR52DRAFT_362757 [Hypoxylon sp. FL1284]
MMGGEEDVKGRFRVLSKALFRLICQTRFNIIFLLFSLVTPLNAERLSNLCIPSGQCAACQANLRSQDDGVRCKCRKSNQEGVSRVPWRKSTNAVFAKQEIWTL